jgi:type I restriction enzyme S subunit
VRANDVLISTVRPNLNAVALVPPSFDGEVASTGFCVLRPRPTELCSQYLFFFAQSAMFVRRLTALATGASYPAVTDADIMEMCIPLPPLREQERIARQLDKADRLRRTRRYTLELSDTFLPAAFLQIFGDPVRNAKSWDVELLEDVCDPKSGIKAGPFGSSLKKEIYSKSGIRIYGQEQVIAGDFSVGDYYISLGMFEEFRSYEVRPGDMLLSLVGTFGKVVVVPEGIERGIINPRLLKISPLRDRLDSVFLKHFIQHPIVQVSLERKSHGGTMGILNAGLLKQVRVIVPPLPMQLQFAKLVARYEHLRAVQRESLRQAEHLFQTLLHSAFASDV